MVTGFAFLSRLAQIAQPPTRFVFLGAGLRLGLPSHPASRRRSCLRLGVSTTSSSRGLSPPIDRPCRAYSRVAGGHFRRKREAPLILRGSTSQFRGHPRTSPVRPVAPFTGCQDLQIRRFLYRHPASFRSVRGLGLVSARCPCGSGPTRLSSPVTPSGRHS